MMVQSIKSVISRYGIQGDILLYRDTFHRKKEMLEYVVDGLDTEGKEVCTISDGAFGLFLARALPNNVVHTCYNIISPDYGEVMEQQSNLVLHSGLYRNGYNASNDYNEFVKRHPEYVYINQFEDSAVKDYYKNYFPKLVWAVNEYKVDAFCDYSHSGATLAGFMENNEESLLTNWKFILGSVDMKFAIYADKPFEFEPRNYLSKFKDKLDIVSCNYYNTYDLGIEIETEYPEFGNVYEATRSISAAMKWLESNPNKTVLVYVGDSFIKEGTKFNDTSKSYIGSQELYFCTKVLEAIHNNTMVDRKEFEKYYKLLDSEYDEQHKKYIFSKLLSDYCNYLTVNGALENTALKLQFEGYLKEFNTELKQSTFELIDKITSVEKNADWYGSDLKNAIIKESQDGKNFLMLWFAFKEMLWGKNAVKVLEDEMRDIYEYVKEQAEKISNYLAHHGTIVWSSL